MLKKCTLLLGKIEYFFIPFLVWIIVGLLLQINYSEEILFYFINKNYTNLFLDYAMILFSFLGRAEFMTIVLFLYFLFKNNRTLKNMILILMFAIFCPLIITMLKNYYHSLRPLKFWGESVVYHLTYIDNSFFYSFPSGHTMGTFGFFTILTYLISTFQKRLGVLFFSLAICCGISRIYLGQHFFDDVLMGSIFGVLLSLVLILIVENLIFLKNEN